MSANLNVEAFQTDRDRRLLSQLGFPPIDPVLYPNAFAEIRRIACRLRQTGCRAIGFAPADDEVGAIALAVHVALAISQLQGPSCVVMDGNTVSPEFAHSPQFANIPADLSGIRTLRIAERVALATRTTAACRLILADTAPLIEFAKRQYDYVFLDLTGLSRWGEHCATYDLIDGVVVVALTDKTLEKDILTCTEDIPPKKRLGVVLVG